MKYYMYIEDSHFKMYLVMCILTWYPLDGLVRNTSSKENTFLLGSVYRLKLHEQLVQSFWLNLLTQKLTLEY